jgi:hypothetical protein
MNKLKELYEWFFNVVILADRIAIINLILTIGIGAWIGINFHKKYNLSIALKTYFTKELELINTEYSDFFQKLYENKFDSKFVQEWFKIMNIKIEIFEKTLCNEFKIDSTLLKNHITFKQFISKTDEFNNNYKNAKINLRPENKNKVLDFQRVSKLSVIDLIVRIQKCKSKRL